MTTATERLIELGHVSGVTGLQGWIKVFSYTDPRENILEFGSWILSSEDLDRRYRLVEGQQRGKVLVAKLEAIDDRDAAVALIGATIAVHRDELPDCGPREYYWADLEGLCVRDVNGRDLGVVEHLIETGAHDVMVLSGGEGRMIPFVLDEIVRQVDLAAGLITVDWAVEDWS